MANKTFTGLYPTTPDKTSNTEFFVSSECIKVFPSSWRGADFVASDVNGVTVVTDRTQFNPESALNTEYNITRTAGGIKTYLEYAQPVVATDGDTSIDCYNLRFFINGYAFEIYNLDTRRFKSDGTLDTDALNLFAAIRVGDLKIGGADIDDTKVLMPYNWLAIDTPIPLDATLRDAYLIDKKYGSTWSDCQMSPGGIKTSILETLENDYIFTGLMLSTDPDFKIVADDNYFYIQLFKDGKVYFNNAWPSDVKGGMENGLSTVIGQPGLKADIQHMLAVGRFNETTKAVESTDQQTIFAVGAGDSDTLRRNAFEVLATQADPDTTTFNQTVKLGGLNVKYNNELIDKGGVIENLYTLNDGIEISENGAGIKINRPIGNKIVTENYIGLHSYGNVDVIGLADRHGSQLRFKDFDTNSGKEKTISTFQIVDVATGASNVKDQDARGLKITNIHEINEEALIFRPCNAGEIKSQLKSINKGSIEIDNHINYDHSIKIGPASNKESALIIGGDDAIVLKRYNDKNYLNHIEIKEQSVAGKVNTDSLYNVTGIYNKRPEVYNNGTDNNENSDNIRTNPNIHFDYYNITKDEDKTQARPAGTGTKIVLDGDVEITGKTFFSGGLSFDERKDDRTAPTQNADVLLKRYLLDFIYPVGSIYMTMSNENPNIKFGCGTEWDAISQGRVLLGAGLVQTGCPGDPGDPDNPEDSSKLKELVRTKLNLKEDSTFRAEETGGNYISAVTKHTHPFSISKDDSKVDTISITWEDTPRTKYKSVEHNHTINASADSKHHHTIPTSYPKDTGKKFTTDPKCVANLGWCDWDSSETIFTKFTSDRGWGSSEHTTGSEGSKRYQQTLINIMEASPIPTVASGSNKTYNAQISWNYNPSIKDNGVKTGYFGLPDCSDLYPWDDGFGAWWYSGKDIANITANDIWGNSFVSRVNRLFNAMFAANFKWKSQGGADKSVDDFANDNYTCESDKEDLLYFYVPRKIRYLPKSFITGDLTGAADFPTENTEKHTYIEQAPENYENGGIKPKTISLGTNSLDDIGFWKGKFKTMEQVQIPVGNPVQLKDYVWSPIMCMHVGKTSDDWSSTLEENTPDHFLDEYIWIQFEYSKYDVGLITWDGDNPTPTTINGHEAGHLHYHLQHDYVDTKGADKRDVYLDFLRDFFDVINHSEIFYRPDGEHTHTCDDASIYHNHTIDSDILAHTHEAAFEVSKSTEDAVVTKENMEQPQEYDLKLPPYLVCNIWQRVK